MKTLDGGYLKISFFEFLQDNQKGVACNLLSCLIASYSIPMVGIEIAINVDPIFQEKVGKIIYERMLFPFNVNLWDYTKERSNVTIDLPGTLAEKILLLQNRQIIKTGIDYIQMIIPTKQISSFILKP